MDGTIKWPDVKIAVKTGAIIPRPTFHNAQVAIMAIGVRGYQDVFHGRMVVYTNKDEKTLSDDVVSFVRGTVVRKLDIDPGKNNMHDALENLCIQDIRNPVTDYLDSLEWDGVSRVGTWLVDYLGAEDNEYVREIGAIVLIAAVRRARHPGTKFDTIMVLEGEQGSGKSQAISILAGHGNFPIRQFLEQAIKSSRSRFKVSGCTR